MTDKVAGPDGSGLSEGLGPLPERASLAQRKADAAALMAVARQAGMAVQADDFGRGTYLFSTVDVLERLLDSARRIAEAPLRAEIADAVHAMRAYARDNPRHEYQGATQDPNGVHAGLARNDKA